MCSGSAARSRARIAARSPFSLVTDEISHQDGIHRVEPSRHDRRCADRLVTRALIKAISIFCALNAKAAHLHLVVDPPKVNHVTAGQLEAEITCAIHPAGRVTDLDEPFAVRSGVAS